MQSRYSNIYEYQFSSLLQHKTKVAVSMSNYALANKKFKTMMSMLINKNALAY